ncbi:MAG: NAD-dependent epimerase/dehydratase family protein, partial [Candidatus Eremiobacteraeota bacterium]|nr:NAD-dependent epimerase/dehydratase family protein [Candidatus Eremiobacteraeota bacterium]
PPDMLILCHESGRENVEDFDVPIPPLSELRRSYESLLAPIKPAACVAIALNTGRLDEASARAAVAAAERENGLPADDVVRFGGAKLWDAIRRAAQTTPKATAWRAAVTT